MGGLGLVMAGGSVGAGQSGGLVQNGSKPAWLTDISAGVREGFDDNVLMVAGKTPGMRPQSSWISTVSPGVGFNAAPWLGWEKHVTTLSLAYAPEFDIYHEAPAETFNAQRITNAITGGAGHFTFGLTNALVFVDGSSQAPTYQLPAGAAEDYNVYAISAARERRKQIQDRSGVVLQYDLDPCFLRPTATLLYYDMMTDWRNGGSGTGPATPGYLNYVGRADVNGGLDAGYRLTPGLAVTLGYRHGHQYQQALPHAINTLMVNGQQEQSSSDYDRILLGVEGNPWKRLAVRVVAGPDFRDYNAAAPVANDQVVKFYADGSLSFAMTAKQSIAINGKHWEWVSSVGRLPCAENSYGLGYHWNATRQLGFDLGARYGNQDYNSGSVPLSSGKCLRNDAMETLSAGVGYAYNAHVSASLTYAYNMGRNLEDNVATGVYRKFDQQLVSLGVKFKF